MKKAFRIVLSFLIFSSIDNVANIYADEFTDAIQDLAIWTACIGQYSSSEAYGGWYEDPEDYYTPKDIAYRLAQESGIKTSTETFYGVCFNYAQHAYSYIEKYKSYYNSKGMYEKQFWLAGVDGNSNIIELSNPTDQANATKIQNGVPIKTYSTSNRPVKTHKGTDGIRARNHAWLWIERNDGVWFWIDPTWTDNLGYVVYGYVANGEEIQLRPDEKYCINYPNYLRNLPTTPEWGRKLAPSNPTPQVATASTSASNSSSSPSRPKDMYYSLGYIGSFNLGNKTELGFFNSQKYGIELSGESFADQGEIFVILAFDSLIDYSDEKSVESWVLGFDWGYGLTSFFQPYFGVLLGLKWTDDFSWGNIGFAWKANSGIRIPLSSFSIRFDVSYGTILGLAGTVSCGIRF